MYASFRALISIFPYRSLTSGDVIGPVTGSVVILFIVAHVLDSARHGFGRDNLIVAVLYRVTWVIYSFALLGLIVLLIMAAYRYISEYHARNTDL